MSGELLCIIPGPDKVLKVEPDDRPTRWCFGCRAHLPHKWVLMGDSKPSYYDPVWILRCPQCNKDRTSFPTGW